MYMSGNRKNDKLYHLFVHHKDNRSIMVSSSEFPFSKLDFCIIDPDSIGKRYKNCVLERQSFSSRNKHLSSRLFQTALSFDINDELSLFRDDDSPVSHSFSGICGKQDFFVVERPDRRVFYGNKKEFIRNTLCYPDALNMKERLQDYFAHNIFSLDSLFSTLIDGLSDAAGKGFILIRYCALKGHFDVECSPVQPLYGRLNSLFKALFNQSLLNESHSIDLKLNLNNELNIRSIPRTGGFLFVNWFLRNFYNHRKCRIDNIF